MRADQILTSPLFGLDGTRDPEFDDKIARYTDLTTKRDLSPDEQEEQWERVSWKIKRIGAKLSGGHCELPFVTAI